MTVNSDGERYILTCDLGEKLGAFQHSNLRVPGPDDEIVASIQHRIAADLATALDQCEVISLSVTALSAKIHQTVGENCDLNDVTVVSTFPEGISLLQVASIESNRIYSLQGTLLGIGPRPGNRPLADQLAEVARLADGRPVVLVEDGIFSGNTMVTLVRNMKEYGVRPELIVAGFAFERSIGALESLMQDGIVVLTVYQFGSVRDWVPDHDFIPFMPGSGRVIGCGTALDILSLTPLYTEDTLTYSVPYLYPFTGDIESWEKWTGIGRVSAREFSRNRIEDTLALFDYLEHLNGRNILIKDLVQGRQRVSVPVSVNQDSFPASDQRVIDYLVGATSLLR